jgi:hypothetical protein
MAAAFGFSIGDFINGIILVKDVIQALSDSRGSSKEYSETMSQLHILKLALGQIEGQFADLQSSTHWTALAGTLTSVGPSSMTFCRVSRNIMFYLSRKGPSAIWKDALRKIQWQLSMPEDLVAFRGKLSYYVYAIGMLLHTIQ